MKAAIINRQRLIIWRNVAKMLMASDAENSIAISSNNVSALYVAENDGVMTQWLNEIRRNKLLVSK
jgi:DNA-binding Xre family transcriptional regulator